MCYAVYIGTDHPLQTAEWDEDDRQFCLAPLAEEDEPVRSCFSKPYIYYAGSHLRCSCGFFYNSLVFTDDPEMMRHYEASQRSAQALVAVLREALAISDTVEVFVTWEGRQAEPPTRKRTMLPEDLLSPLHRYAEDADEEVQMADSPVDEQDFIVMQKGRECLTGA